MARKKNEIFICKRDSGALKHIRAQRSQLLRGRPRPGRFSDGQDLEHSRERREARTEQ